LPARLTRLISAAAHFGITIEKPSHGSHWKAKKPKCRTYPIPAHKGERTMISDRYLRGFCDNFGIELEDLQEKL
jgi:hypothetical protein